VDGDPSWFFQGQPSSTPGISRSPFGIPTNCLSEVEDFCFPGHLSHYTWQLELPGGEVIGTSIQTAENEATFILSDPELNSAILGCFLTDPEFYSGLVLQTETPVGPLPVVNYNRPE
jgi:hypothetical protein